jgi:periplasmic divalent cation tolerance protein
MAETSSHAVIILVTAPDAETASAIGRALVEERLAACANVIPGLRSTFRWEGKVQEEAEVLMLVKARRADVQAISTRVRELHPYEVPEVVATDIVAGLDAYLEWIATETERS